MLQTVTIQNFRSLRDVTVNLQKVNLLIGPNNSGKSNFLKALAFMKEHYNGGLRANLIDFERCFYNHSYKSSQLERNINWKASRFSLLPIRFSCKWTHEGVSFNDVYQLELFGFNKAAKLVFNEGLGYLPKEESRDYDIFYKIIVGELNGTVVFQNNQFYNSVIPPDEIAKSKGSAAGNSLLINSLNGEVSFYDYHYDPGTFLNRSDSTDDFAPGFSITELFNSIRIYKPDPAKITTKNMLLTDKHVNEDCSNLVAFLDNMRDGNEDVWLAIQKDLHRCMPDFVGISFDKILINNTESIGKRFGLRDKKGEKYWAEELSEGTIYFLALLAIVHQPNPPKVLLLEEPEKGIHPRRIAEVMDLIFKLAEEKDIQIILTSHSTQVVDAFQDIPESVFVFDMVDGETKIKNLQTDILDADAKDAEEKGFPPIDYSKRTLSEHWATGLLGGVPH